MNQLDDTLASGTFRQSCLSLDPEPQMACERLDRLDAPKIGARMNRGDRGILEDFNEVLGLRLAGFGQRPEAVITFPVGPVARLCMPDQVRGQWED